MHKFYNRGTDGSIDGVEFLASWRAWLCTSCVVLFVFLTISFLPGVHSFFQTKIFWPAIVYMLVPCTEFFCTFLYKKGGMTSEGFWLSQIITSLIFELSVALLIAFSSWKGATIFSCIFLMLVLVHAYGLRANVGNPFLEIGVVLIFIFALIVNHDLEHIVIFFILIPITIVAAFLVGHAAVVSDKRRFENERLKNAVQNHRILCETARADQMASTLETLSIWNHDMRNNLVMLNGQFSLVGRLVCSPKLLAEIKEAEVVQTLLANIRKNVDFFSNGLNEMRQISKELHEQNQKVEDILIEPEVRHSIDLLSLRFPETSFEFSASLTAPMTLPVVGGSICFHRIIENLLANACEGDGTTKASHVQITSKIEEEFYSIEIRDNGPGFREALLSPVLCHFQTTKAHGTGLGLLAVEKLIIENKGQLMRKNLPEGGASVTVFFPKKPKSVSENLQPSESRGEDALKKLA